MKTYVDVNAGAEGSGSKEAPFRYLNDALEQELYEYISNMYIVDGHEHLIPEEKAIAAGGDFTNLFNTYCVDDFRVAGMSSKEVELLYTVDTPLEQKWQIFSRYYPLVEDTSYFHAIKLVMKHTYGIEELNQDTYEVLSKMLRENRKPGYYQQVYEDCKIKHILNNPYPKGEPCPVYFYTQKPDEFQHNIIFVPGPPSREDLTSEGSFYSSVLTTDDLDCRAGEFVKKLKDTECCGVKVSNYYPYIETSVADAAAELKKVLGAKEGKNRSIRLYWYVLDRILDEVEKEDLTTAIHTGYWGDFRHNSPEKYIDVLGKHPKNRFDLFHLGYPYVKSSLLLAKTLPNVNINLGWTYIISQQFAKDSLMQILDFIPRNKVIGFGGDYFEVESIYGHREMMNQTMAKALAAKVGDCSLSLGNAKKWADAMLWDNPINFYRL